MMNLRGGKTPKCLIEQLDHQPIKSLKQALEIPTVHQRD